MRISAMAAAAVLAASPALALVPDLAPTIRDNDLVRIEQLDDAAGRTLLNALATAAPEDSAVLIEALQGAPLPPDQAQAVLPGDWSCRMLKLGGLQPLVIYSPFTCRIEADGTFAKPTGSQRMTGQIGTLDGGLFYLGTGYVAGDTPPPYVDLPSDIDVTASPQRVPEVGLVQVTGPTRARILMPLPMLESDLNILFLTR